MTTASRSPSHVATCMAALLLSSSIACGGKSGASPPTTDDGGTAVTLTAALVSAESASPAAARFASAAATTALEAWILRCTTYTTPALSAYGTSDRLGVVSLVLPAGSRTAPFGCHVEDPTGAQVAVMELADGLSTVRTIAVPGDTDLGPLAVDAASGTALGTVPAGAIVRPAISAAARAGAG